MYEGGYKRLSESIADDELILRPMALQVFIYFLSMASFKDNFYQMNGQIVKIQAGQFLTGEISLAKKFNVSRKKIRVALNFLERKKIIHRKRAIKFSLISIVKYGIFTTKENKKGHQRAIKGPTKGQQRATLIEGIESINKKEKNKQKKKQFSPSKKLSLKSKEIKDIFNLWHDIEKKYTLKAPFLGHAALDYINRYIEKGGNISDVLKAFERAKKEQLSKWHLNRNIFTFEYFFKTSDSKGHPVNRINKILSGELIEKEQQPATVNRPPIYKGPPAFTKEQEERARLAGIKAIKAFKEKHRTTNQEG